MNKLTVGVVLVAVLAVGAVLVQKNRLHTSNAQKDQPPVTVAAAWSKLQAAHSAHIATALAINLPTQQQKDQARPIIDVAIRTQGDSNWADKLTYAGDFTIEAKGRGMQLSTDGDIRLLPDKVAFNLHNLPTLLNPSGSLLNKWTIVNSTPFKITNAEEVTPALKTFFDNWVYKGDDNIHGPAHHYTKDVSDDEAKALQNTFSQHKSGSAGLNIIARLLQNFAIDQADAWVGRDNQQLQRLSIHFKKNESKDQQASLQFDLSDYGKQVAVDAPQEELNVKPEVFEQLFGTGNVGSVKK
jgi:hypothetical protein